MYKYNKIEFNEENIVDIELLHLERLIEEREAYEEEFFSMKPRDEIDNPIIEYEPQDNEVDCIPEAFEVDSVYPFEDEDYQNQLRDEKLIEEREAYELNCLEIVPDYFALNDFYDSQIAAMEEEEFIERNGYGYDYKYEPEDYDDQEYAQYEEDMFFELYYLRKESSAPPICGCADLDYMPHDDGFCDCLDCYDYPEGPQENLCGLKYY